MPFVKDILEQFPESGESLGLRPLSNWKISILIFSIGSQCHSVLGKVPPGASWGNLKYWTERNPINVLCLWSPK